ncbi:penicillin-insensitive murein endopeptidase [Vibrio sp. SCSIO 43136]|uniref:penicillin-insensitive murein endopeptidase n=1 Tax=Vibrio sp. SCSIO 43136 TaxID=2819101 RepID=UPI002074FA36|nr:penicillin-insensitive murein endopeptidase [Vibrio sp. SCSIO 43136]USD66614.1 penicillin-insensitive murein endopeptidase [Vibrio sp. SCSIO 43136]
MRLWILTISLVLSASSFATSWEQFSAPTLNPTQAFGSYANGCLDGAAALPLQGHGYQVLRSNTGRYYGHPSTISFIEHLATLAATKLDTRILIGDISLPRGGRFSSGHSSHQIGLDVDIWLKLADAPLTMTELNAPNPYSVVDLKNYKMVDTRWDERHFGLIRYAAMQQSVARIFVHPVIKQKLCDSEVDQSEQRRWLRKVRPWWGHHYHFHVRLKCPKDSPNCRNQNPPPKGDGCGSELASWKPTPKPATPVKVDNNKKAQVKKTKKVLPKQCVNLLAQK